jgi:hypothetical protein
MVTKRSRVFGLPIGRSRADWRLGMLSGFGVGVLSGAMTCVGLRRVLSEGVHKATETMDKVGRAADQASSLGESLSEPVAVVNAVIESIVDEGEDREPTGPP